LEDETVLAELDWKIERDFDEETGQLVTVNDVGKLQPQTALSLSLKNQNAESPNLLNQSCEKCRTLHP